MRFRRVLLACPLEGVELDVGVDGVGVGEVAVGEEVAFAVFLPTIEHV